MPSIALGVFLHSWMADWREDASTARTNRFIALTAASANPLLWEL